ncbi:MAG: hypothetical protein KA974_07050 [Saprospiraceae bacterium]|nr:hypothetical protein [Saprospiraceae bacterium]
MKYFLQAFLLLLTIVAVIVFFAIESWHISNTIDASKMMMYGAIFGLVLGLVIAFMLNQDETDEVGKIRNYAVGIICMPLITMLLGALINHHFADEKPTMKEFTFVKEEPYGRSRFGASKEAVLAKPDGYFLWVKDTKTSQKFRLRQPTYQSMREGDPVMLPIYSGFWGFDIFLEK